MSYVLGLDLGTSSLKGIVINQSGQIVHTDSYSYSLQNPKPGYSEQDPSDWIEACDKLFIKLSKEVEDFRDLLEGISFSGQMHSLVLTDKDDNILRPAILWNDVRNAKQCEQISADFGKELLAITKNIALEGFTLPKILWVQQNEPELWKQVGKIFLPKDYLRYHLTGQYHMDYSDAAGTLLMDTTNKEWSLEVLEKYKISTDILSELVPSTEYIGLLKEELKVKYGFKNDVKVFAGGADNACSSLGAGLIDTDTALVSIGTSGVFLSIEDNNHDEYAGKIHLFNHVIPQSYYSMGVTLAAGHSLSWFKNLFSKDIDFDKLLENISHIPIGSEGLLFTPYISGERTPHVDSKIRGSFIGLGNQHTRDHLTRAVIEGITFSLKDSQNVMETLSGKKFKQIISVGGGSKNKEWLQIQADIFDAEIVSLKNEEGPGLGAAILAAYGLDWYKDLETTVSKIVDYNLVVKPNKQNVKKYKELYSIYTSVYDATKDISHRLNEI